MCLYDINSNIRNTLFLCQKMFETENKTLKDNIANAEAKNGIEDEQYTISYVSHEKSLKYRVGNKNNFHRNRKLCKA